MSLVATVPETRFVRCGYNCGRIVTEANPPDPDPLEEIRLFAIMGTWMEADVVAATVSSALTQGCERVYLVDNDSPDDTVKVALDAGATLAAKYTTPHFDEHMRRMILNSLVALLSLQEGADHIWWLHVDGDSPPSPPTLRRASLADGTWTFPPESRACTCDFRCSITCTHGPGSTCPQSRRRIPWASISVRGTSWLARTTPGSPGGTGTSRPTRCRAP